MEKLIELLNEYEKNNVVNWYERSNDEGVLTCRYIKENFLYYYEEASTIAISKYYGFIEWLVRNDHIDFKKLDTPRFNQLVDNTLDSYFALLMVLAIQDEPVRFISKLLK